MSSRSRQTCPIGNCAHTARMRAMRRHVHKKHDAAPVVCDECNEPFLSKKAFKSHNGAKHGGTGTSTCHGPDLIPTGGKQQEKVTSSMRTIPCECGRGFATEKALQQHRNSGKHALALKTSTATLTRKARTVRIKGRMPISMRTIPCECGRRFATDKALQQHQECGKQHRRLVPTQTSYNTSSFAQYSFSPNRASNYSSTSPSSTAAVTSNNLSIQSSTLLYSRANTNLSSVTPEELDAFIANTVQPDSAYLASCNACVDRLVSFLQSNVPNELRPSRVVKGGSLGKGTAVKGKSDIDLTVMLGDYDNVRELVNDMPGLLSTLKRYLGNFGEVRVVGTTRHAIQVELSCHSGYSHSVDILPAVDVTRKESVDQIYTQMKGRDSDIKKFYSASLAPLQMKLYSVLPTKLKSLIRLVKYWKKETLVSDGIPTSYVFELIILDAWSKAGKPQTFSTAQLFRAVLDSLVHHTHFKIFLSDESNYSKSEAQIRHSTYIMDPCNPTNDVYNSRTWDWDAVAKEAQRWLNKPLFFGVGGLQW